jgi:glutamine synthetase
LVKGEPDGSSFPNGGIRGTFEARGYTAWDVTSPAYIMNTDNGKTLMSADGVHLLDRRGAGQEDAAAALQRGHGQGGPARAVAAGRDRHRTGQLQLRRRAGILPGRHQLRQQRPDLLLAGRTLFGKPPAKGQEFDDHYFGAIPERVQVFMQDVEEQLYKLSIPAKTRHNEVAPGQFEIAPYFETANVAADHQQLLMTILKATAKRHGLTCLLHEKPFAGINGSGKHVNWSIGNATQGNLLDPGQDTPREHPVPAVLRRRDSRRAQVRAAAARGHRLRRQRPSSRRQRGAAGHHVGLSGQPARGRLRADQQGQR